DVLGGGIHTTSLLREGVRSDVPFPAVAAGEACPMCVALDRDADEAARQGRLVHHRMHAEIMLLLERLLDPASAASYRDPVWSEQSGRHILREPNQGDPVASQVFFVLHRHRFGQFVRASLDAPGDEVRLRLLDDRGQILELRGHAGRLSRSVAPGRPSGFCESPAWKIISTEWTS